MTRKIICPTDFTAAANNAIEYAARLCQVFKSPLQLIHVHTLPLLEGYNNPEKIAAEWKITERASDTLNKICTETSAVFKVPCFYEADITTVNMERIISRHTDQKSMVVMGTNGIDSLYQFFWGTNTYNVIRESKCPVFVVPENVIYEPIRNIVFAWDIAIQNKLPYSQLHQYIAHFSAKCTFLYISQSPDKIPRQTFDILQNSVLHELDPAKETIDFKQEVSGDLAVGINDYMNRSGAHLLILSTNDHSLIKNLFHKSLTKYLVETAGYPILVLPV